MSTFIALKNTELKDGQIKRQGVSLMLWTIFIILLVLWILGLVFKIAGGLIHVLLVIAIIVLVIRLFTGNRKS
ncbi:lmo0937 family membrane protein [Virgibacillus dakarensis]|uniref:lmo0937 family membrane protein n=1 Tax=Virgibacillus dakarensis TaxID=1917889 RepID=UPI000B4365E4